MALANPTLVVRVAANLAELKKNLKEGRDQIEVTSAAMSKLSNSFSGTKLIQSAHAVTAAIQKVGVATLSTSEGARSLDLLDKAMDKLLRTGQQVPLEMSKTAAELRRMNLATEEADKTVNSISASYRQFDGILQSLGINIGPYVKGLEDITSLATSAAKGLGLMAGAAAVLATAVASWQFGRHIGEVSGLTEAIARGTAVLKGYGDVQQEEMLARMQSIELAGKAQENWKRQAESIAAAQKAAEEEAASVRANTFAGLQNASQLEALEKQLAKVKQQRLDDARATFAASQAQSAFGKETEITTQAVKDQSKAVSEHLAAVARDAEEARQKVANFMNAATLNSRTAESLSFDVSALTQTELSRLNAQYDPFGRGGDTGLREKLKQLEASENTIAPKSYSQYSQVMADKYLLAQLRMYFGETPGFAAGVKNFRGGMALVGERGPEMVRLPAGSDVIPNHQLGGNVTIAPVIHVHGSTISTKAELNELVTAAMIDFYRSHGLPIPTKVA